MRIPILSAIILIIISVSADLYILKDIRENFRKKYRKVAVNTHWVLSVLFWIFLAFIIFMPKRSESQPILALMWMLFSYLSVYIPKIIYCLCSLIGRCFRRFSRRRVNYGIIPGIVLGAVFFVAMWWGALFTRHEVEVNTVDIVSDRLPASFDGFKIVQFSDAHVGTWGNDTAFISKVVDSINAQNADLILFTGDIVNRKSSELEPFRKVFSRLRARQGVIAVLGNHDYASYVDWASPEDEVKDKARLNRMIREMGWNLFFNEHHILTRGTDSIAIIGVENWGEPPFNTNGDLDKAFLYSKDSVNYNFDKFDSKYKILLSHNPEHWNQEVSQKSNIDLTLSGHTHAMQCMIKIGEWKWSPAALRYKRWGGLYEERAKDNTPIRLYVNIGIGEVGFPARIGAVPELTVFNLHSAKN